MSRIATAPSSAPPLQGYLRFVASGLFACAYYEAPCDKTTSNVRFGAVFGDFDPCFR